MEDAKLSHVKTLKQLKRLDQAAKYQNAVRLSQLINADKKWPINDFTLILILLSYIAFLPFIFVLNFLNLVYNWDKPITNTILKIRIFPLIF